MCTSGWPASSSCLQFHQPSWKRKTWKTILEGKDMKNHPGKKNMKNHPGKKYEKPSWKREIWKHILGKNIKKPSCKKIPLLTPFITMAFCVNIIALVTFIQCVKFEKPGLLKSESPKSRFLRHVDAEPADCSGCEWTAQSSLRGGQVSVPELRSGKARIGEILGRWARRRRRRRRRGRRRRRARGDFGEVATLAKASGQHFSSVAFPAFLDFAFYAFWRRDRKEF